MRKIQVLRSHNIKNVLNKDNLVKAVKILFIKRDFVCFYVA